MKEDVLIPNQIHVDLNFFFSENKMGKMKKYTCFLVKQPQIQYMILLTAKEMPKLLEELEAF